MKLVRLFLSIGFLGGALAFGTLTTGCGGTTDTPDSGTVDNSGIVRCKNDSECLNGQTCASNGTCVDKTVPKEDAGTQTDAGTEAAPEKTVTEEPSGPEKKDCNPGTVGCRCSPTGACAQGLRCEFNICQTCTEGTAGCACKDGKTCNSGLQCQDGTCQGCVGKANCPCHGNNSCDTGFRCERDNNGASICQTCKSEDMVGCNCSKDTECSGSLICVNKRCIDASKLNQIPKSPKCYYPCQDDVKMPDGTIKSCHPEYKLIEGCPGGQKCVEGSCVNESRASNLSSTQYPFCQGDSDCPDWQACVGGRCYSTCSSSSECASGFKCHAYVCRRECTGSTSDCSPETSCRNQASGAGVCMPNGSRKNTNLAQTSTPGTFHVTINEVNYSNTVTTGVIGIINKSKFNTNFKISRASDNIGSKNPLFWLKFDMCKTYTDDGQNCKTWGGSPTAAEPFEIKNMEPNKMYLVQLSNAGGKPSASATYSGILKVIGDQLGDRDLAVQYRQSAQGQWKGTMVAFGNFRDQNIAKFPNTTGLQIRDLDNALLRRWLDFKNNGISFEKFVALLRSVREGSWQLPKVASDCKTTFSQVATDDVVCYPFSSSRGYEVLSYSNREAPVPSGISELNFVVNVKEKTTTTLEGRIDTSQALQYSGNPRITISFKNKLDSSPRIAMNSFDAVIDIGGRYYVSDSESCSDSSNFDKQTLPWMVPGFEAMSYPRTGSLFRDRFECRTKSLPTTPPPGATADQIKAVEDYNKSLAASNPIPNGWRLRRKLEMVDGMMINNRYMFVLYKETFVSFFNTGASSNALNGDFVNYGYILMERVPVDLQDSDYASTAPVTLKTCSNDSGCTSGTVCRGNVCRPPSKLNQVSCDPEIVKKATNIAIQKQSDLGTWSQLRLNNLVTALLGEQVSGTTDNSSMLIQRQDTGGGTYQYSYNNPNTNRVHFIHYLCEDTGQFNGGPISSPTDCPADSKVIFFEVPGITEGNMRADSCNTNKTCGTRWNSIKTITGYRENVPYKCSNSNEVFCDRNRKDLREGKVFYKPTLNSNTFVSPFGSLRNALFEAFRYRIKFQTRSGKGIGFTPSICAPGASSLSPYCFEPSVIEEIEERVNCLESVFADETLNNRLSSTVRGKLVNFLIHAFSYSNRTDTGSIITDLGFESLNAELKVMLGDEAFTRSFASRYDLSNSNLVSFQGELLENNGINLSGALGYEMYNLYLSVQYYQMVLDRFFAQSDVIYRSFQKAETAFIKAKSVTSYFPKLLQASTRKARSWSQIAKRYHALNRADLARSVIERAYASTFMEMTVLTRLLRNLTNIIDPKELAQISTEIERVARIYKSSLLDMEETYKKLNMSLNHFGLPEGYMPFPAMDSFSATTQSVNAFTVALSFAKEKMNIAQNKEQVALQTKRSFDTNAASFQNELVRIEQNYENQLLEICGGVTVTDTNGQTRTYPAIPRYAVLSPKTREMGDPCGRVSGGSLFNAMAEMEKMKVNVLSINQSMQNLKQQITLEEERIQKYCDAKFKLADITWNYRSNLNNLQMEIEDTQRNVDRVIRVSQTYSQAAEMVKCSTIVGTASGGDCITAAVGAGLVLGIGVLQEAGVLYLESQLKAKREEQLELEKNLEKTQLQFECRACDVREKTCDSSQTGTAQVESQIKIKELTSQIMNLNYEALKAQYDVQIAASNINRLRQQARRLMTQQDEATQMAVNVQAAQNDPNVRIYKNDAIISAERTFNEAMTEAYRATIIYEYYTGTTYARKGDLYLIRMVSYGDKNLETYVSQLEQAFRAFEEENGKPDIRVLQLSLRDDILEIPRVDDTTKEALGLNARISMLQTKLADRNLLNSEGYTSIPFSISVRKPHSLVSPITFNHKIVYVEAVIHLTDPTDETARLYLRQKGTSVVRLKGDELKYYALPQRTAVINPKINGTLDFSPEVYKNYRLRDRPLGNTQWQLLINQVTEKANMDINLNSVTDIILYIYYSDFTEEK
ncbi:MAG: hypothetical protein EP343_18580 [Deltaproteobacteria bacterium]|nr:MAG: hypothetical protein EP343_18580 [Deltaproteobacteria bacterium]